MQPEDPAGASYQRAADALALRDFTVERNSSGPLSAEALRGVEVLVLSHPCDPRWERTTSRNSPALSPDEVEAVLRWVSAGGGLLVITEYEHEKYGDNLNELLAPAGIQIENGKVFDRSSCEQGNPEWFLAAPEERSPLGHLAASACFYRAGWCALSGGAHAAWRAGSNAFPPSAAVIATGRIGDGRVAAVMDSVLFGDERLGEHDHEQLWLNLVYWLAAGRPPREARSTSHEIVALNDQLLPVIAAINRLRLLQQPDGSIAVENCRPASILVQVIRELVSGVEPGFPHEAEYFAALDADFGKWATSGFTKPDFTQSLEAFAPQVNRRDELLTLAIFPMYTPNASSDTRFEAILYRTPWPDWIALLERNRFHNSKFVPGHLLAFTEGYRSECAVFFPETVSVSGRAPNQFGTIFCDREAERLQCVASSAAKAVRLDLHPELEFWLNSQVLVEDTLVLWDLIHDTSHSAGELPFDPFMVRQRAPFWMYGLEELRVDLRSYGEALRLSTDAMTPFPFARYVTYAILLDRIFRFPITGNRVRNYDALGGQLLFAFLHQRDVLIWSDNRLTIRWEELDSAIAALRDELRTLYKLGSACSKMTFWLAAHDLISKYVRPNVGSKWKAETRAITDEADLKRWIDLVHPDEFPLGTFHINLRRMLQAV
jgi:hypothetical protein